MLHLEILRNTDYNPMIYIPFFIVILIDKRGGKRGGKREKERERLEHKYEHITLHHRYTER